MKKLYLILTLFFATIISIHACNENELKALHDKIDILTNTFHACYLFHDQELKSCIIKARESIYALGHQDSEEKKVLLIKLFHQQCSLCKALAIIKMEVDCMGGHDFCNHVRNASGRDRFDEKLAKAIEIHRSNNRHNFLNPSAMVSTPG